MFPTFGQTLSCCLIQLTDQRVGTGLEQKTDRNMVRNTPMRNSTLNWNVDKTGSISSVGLQ